VGLASRRRPLALLAVLTVQGEQGISRDRAASLLWGDTDDKHALRSLSDALYTIRSDLSPDAVVSTATELRLNRAVVASDVAAFVEAKHRGDRAAAVAAYRGPLLEGFHLAGAQLFEEWLDAERRRFTEAFAEALEGLALEARRAGDSSSAVTWWRRLVAEDPYNSRVAIELARVLALAGDPGNALQSLRDHVRELRVGLEAEPDAEVLRLIEELRTGAGRPLGPRAAVGPVPSGSARGEAGTRAGATRSIFDSGSGASWGSDDAGAGVVAQPDAAGGLRAPRAGEAPGTPIARAIRLLGARPAWAVVALAALLAVGWLSVRLLRGSIGPPIRRIVVLPLKNLTGDSTAGALVDGVTEELTARLGQLAVLEVISRTTAEHYRDSKLSGSRIAAELGVEGLLEGAVVRWANRVRATIQVIDARRDRHLAAKTVDLPWDALEAVPAALADAVLQRLRVEPTSEERRRLERPASRNPRVAALLTQDRWEEALALDSNDARAWAAKSLAMSVAIWMPTRDVTWRAAPYVRAARVAADRALLLDSSESTAWHAYGMAANYENDLMMAERALRRAVALQPSNAAARSDLGGVLALLGRLGEAVDEVQHATRLDPQSGRVRVNLNWVLLVAKRWDEYDRAAAEWLRLGWGKSALIGGSQMIVTFCRGRTQEALAQVDSALDLDGKGATKRHDLMRAVVFARLGQMDSARATVRRAEQLTNENVKKFWLAWAYAWIGETDRAVNAYRDSYAMGEGGLQATVVTCLADPLREDPRWPELLGLLNLRP
jgi:DNA-binding SARP family transcriptional activator/TolB-like protein/Tfp pilus assembly protein PilF